MATVTGFTAARMQAIEDQAIVSGSVSSGDLILSRHDGSTINAGSVIGPPGPTGPPGSLGGTVGSSDNAIVRADGTGGTVVQGSGAFVTDTGRLIVPDATVSNAPTADTDATNKLYVDGAGKGILGSTINSSVVPLSIGNWVSVTGLSITLTPEVGRYYRFDAQTFFMEGGGGGGAVVGCAFAIFKSTDLVTPVMRTNSIIAPKSGTAMGTTATISRVIQIPSGWGVSTTFIARAWIDTFADIRGDYQAHTFSIEDVGLI